MDDGGLYGNILVPTDGSDAANVAVDHAITLASAHNARIHGLFVVDSRITMAADAEMREDLTERLRRRGEAAIDSITDRAGAADVRATGSVTRGTPWKEILAQASERGVDVIIIGTTGKSPREKRVGMGSVSERVVDDATVPVLVVPDSHAEGVE